MKPLMPIGTAVWLVDNTSLTFEQIAEFCGLHTLEVHGIADGEVAKGIVGKDPIQSKQLTRDEISRCEANPAAKLVLSLEMQRIIKAQSKKKGAKYVPIAKRQNKPDAIAWFLRYAPGITDVQIVKLIGTTKPMIQSVRDRSHYNIQEISPKDPVLLGLCSQTELDKVLAINAAKLAEEQKKPEQEVDIFSELE